MSQIFYEVGYFSSNGRPRRGAGPHMLFADPNRVAEIIMGRAKSGMPVADLKVRINSDIEQKAIRADEFLLLILTNPV
jgi:hypothetical protein